MNKFFVCNFFEFSEEWLSAFRKNLSTRLPRRCHLVPCVPGVWLSPLDAGVVHREAQALITEHLPEHAIFFLQVVDDIDLLTGTQPAKMMSRYCSSGKGASMMVRRYISLSPRRFNQMPTNPRRSSFCTLRHSPTQTVLSKVRAKCRWAART